jgi:hypothetical protein
VNIVGASNQEYIIMQKKIEFEVAFQIHQNRTCRHKLLFICVKLLKEKNL